MLYNCYTHLMLSHPAGVYMYGMFMIDAGSINSMPLASMIFTRHRIEFLGYNNVPWLT